MFNHTLSAIMRGRWFLNKEWANDHIPMVMLMLQGGKVDFTSNNVDRSGNQSVELPFCIDPATMQRYEMYRYSENGYGPNANIPKGSVGVIPISGPITKYNGECGEPGAITRATWFNEMGRRDNISSVIFLLDTPGGEARAANTLTEAIRKSNKPVLAYVDGMSASLGMYFSTACNETYLSSEDDEIGSIGSYCTLFDFSAAFEKAGIKLLEIYAPQSGDKNKDTRDALAGDTSMIEADLKRGVDSFINSVKIGRPQSAKYEKQWNSGKMFYAQEAIDLKLADGIKSFDQVVAKAAWLSNRKK